MAVTPFSDLQSASELWMSRRRTLWLAFAMVTIIAIGSVIGPLWSIYDKEYELENSLEKRLTLLGTSHTEVIETWLDGLIRQGDRIVNSDLFRLYATEVDLIEADISYLVTGGPTADDADQDSDQARLAAQLPELKNILLEFTRYAGFVSGRLVHPNGQAYLSTEGSTSHVSANQQQLSRQVLTTATPQFSALYATSGGLMLDMALPLFALEVNAEHPSVVAVLVLSKVVTDKINEFLSASPLVEQGERVYLIQKTAGGYAEVAPWRPGQIEPLDHSPPFNETDSLKFAPRTSIRSEQTVYSIATALKTLPWWLIQEADYATARLPLNHYRRTTWSIALLLLSVFTIAFGAIWFQQVGIKNRQIAGHFKELAEQIDSQRQLLNSINDNIGDFISLKDLKGLYQYVNPAMAKALGRSSEEILNRDDCAVFGFDTAKRLEHWDQQVVATGKPVNVQETLYLQSHPMHLLISKVPLRDGSGPLTGIVSVMSDITELVEGQKRHEKTIRRTMDALVGAIELNDNYLAGHSRRLRLLSCEVIKRMGGNEQQVATVEVAANLSQIGKLFIDKQLLAAQRPLTEEERAQMELHVEHAARVLRPIPFELPIPDTIYQMNEHLDGSGYPKGLRGDAIILPARVLCAINSFCAMVEPRAYRTRKPVDVALNELEQMGHRYDLDVVTALRDVVESPLGDKLLQHDDHKSERSS